MQNVIPIIPHVSRVMNIYTNLLLTDGRTDLGIRVQNQGVQSINQLRFSGPVYPADTVEYRTSKCYHSETRAGDGVIPSEVFKSSRGRNHCHRCAGV